VELLSCGDAQVFDSPPLQLEAPQLEKDSWADPPDASSGSAAPAKPLTAAPAPKSECPVFGSGISQGKVKSSAVDEVSGLVASPRNPGILWVHNDSGDAPRLFALQANGNLRGVFKLPISEAIDWEDIAFGPGKNGEPHLYIGDIGDNVRRRSQGIVIHRVPEPKLPAATDEPAAGMLVPVESFRLRYPDGPQDAETLLVDPGSGEVVLLTKSWLGPPRIYFTKELKTPVTVLEGGAFLDLKAAGIPSLTPTAGDVSPDGRWIIVRSYRAAYLWTREPGQALHEVFSSPACPISLEREPQGEALGFSADGRGYFTLSEKRGQPIFHYTLERSSSSTAPPQK
jgi:hypothetical protein